MCIICLDGNSSSLKMEFNGTLTYDYVDDTVGTSEAAMFHTASLYHSAGPLAGAVKHKKPAAGSRGERQHTSTSEYDAPTTAPRPKPTRVREWWE